MKYVFTAGPRIREVGTKKPLTAEIAEESRGGRGENTEDIERTMMAIKDPHSKQLREHVVYLLNGGGAHARFDDVVKNMPEDSRGVRPEGFPHSAWMLLEHLRLAQWDILEFSRNSQHKSPEWPRGYWPRTEAPPSTAAWNKSIQQFRKDLKSLQDLVANPKTDLYARISWGDGQTILREALLVADHNAYHLGQIVDLRRLLGAWKE